VPPVTARTAAAPPDDYPNIGGQHADYLAQALNDYRLGKRKNPIMQPSRSSSRRTTSTRSRSSSPRQQGLATPKHD
jgi:cytochrome c553